MAYSPVETGLFLACAASGSPIGAQVFARRERLFLPPAKRLAPAFPIRSLSVEWGRPLPISWFANSLPVMRRFVQREFPFSSAPKPQTRSGFPPREFANWTRPFLEQFDYLVAPQQALPPFACARP